MKTIERFEIDTEIGDGRVVARGEDCKPVPATGEWCRASDADEALQTEHKTLLEERAKVAELEAECERLYVRLEQEQDRRLCNYNGWVKCSSELEHALRALDVAEARAEAAEAELELEKRHTDDMRAAAESYLRNYELARECEASEMRRSDVYKARAEAAEAELATVTEQRDGLATLLLDYNKNCNSCDYLEAVRLARECLGKDVE